MSEVQPLRPPRTWSKTAAVLVLLVCVTLTAWAVWRSVKQVDERASSFFSYQAGELRAAFERRLAAYEQVLHGAAGLVSAADGMLNEPRWQRYVSQLDVASTYPGLEGLGVANYFQRQVPATFSFPLFAALRLPVFGSGADRVYAPILHYVGNDTLLWPGLDLQADANHRAALARAREAGKLIVGVPLSAASDGTRIPLYLPVFSPAGVGSERPALLGFVLAVVALEDLVHSLGDVLTAGLVLQLETQGEVLYSSAAAQDSNGELRALTDISFNDHGWTLKLYSSPAFEAAAIGSREPVWVLALGVLATLLLFAVVWVMASTQQRAYALAERRTAAWRESEARYSALIDAAPEAILIIDDKGRIVAWNAGAKRIYGYEAEEVIGRSWTLLLPESERRTSARVLAEKARATSPGSRQRVLEVTGCRKNGESFPAEISQGRWQIGDRVYVSSIIRDVSARRRAEQALRESEERFRVALRVADISVFSQDRELRYQWVYNPRYGLKAEDILGKSDRELGALDEMVEFKSRVLQTGQGDRMLYRRLHDGAEIVYNLAVEPVYQKGRVMGLVGAAIDLTALYKAERLQRQSEARFRAIFENAAIGILVTDQRGCVLQANAAFLRKMSLTLDELRDLGPLNELIHPEDRERAIALNKDLIRNGRTFRRQQLRYRLPEGRYIWTAVTASLLRDEQGQPQAAVHMLEDITDLKRAEAELHAAYHELEQRVDERTAELAAKARELERSNFELEQFAYVASHDLQEPLRSVTSFAQLLEQRYGDRLDEQGLRFLRFILSGTERMAALITGLLEYSRVGAKQRPFETVDVGEVLRQARENLAAAIHEREARIRHGELPRVLGDATELVQLFQNLIGNAIKFNDSVPPTVSIDARREGEGYVFSVSDNGVGIAAEDYERIFTIFQRAHGNSGYGGTGVGLAVCRKIVERHLGRIWLQSEPGRGTTFFFTLQAAPAEA